MADKDMSNWVRYMAWGSTIAAALAGLVAGGFFLGRYLDSRLGTIPYLTIVCMLAGLILGIAYLVLSLIKLGKSDHEQ
jgi:F0F1-type ATP synthase assembly protein I